jgi:hypothetical protein
MLPRRCWEERFVTEYNIPALLVVGWEGFFGLFAIILIITVVHRVSDMDPASDLLSAVPASHDSSWGSVGSEGVGTEDVTGDYTPPPGSIDGNSTYAKAAWGGGTSDTVFWFNEDDAFNQFSMPAPNNPTIMVAMVCMIFSIAFFNFFGISVTKKMSAAHRMVLDSVRTIIVWIVRRHHYHHGGAGGVERDADIFGR